MTRRNRNLVALCLVMGLCAAVAGAMPLTQVEDDGTACVLPEFSFEWQGASDLTLVIRSASPRGHLVRLRPPRSTMASDASSSSDASSEKCCLPSEDTPSAYESIVEQSEKKWFGTTTPRRVDDDALYTSQVDIDPNDLNLYEGDGNVIIDWAIRKSDRVDGAQCLESGTTPPITVFRRHIVAFDVGSVFSLENDGSFANGLELAISSSSHWTNWLRGYSDLRFSRVGDIAEEEPETMSETDPMGGDDDPTADPTEPDDDVNFDPLSDSGNVVSFNGWIGIDPFAKETRFRRSPAFSIILGGGFKTRTSEESGVDAQIRYFGGFRFQVARYHVEAEGDYSGTSGFLQFGASRDEFWKYTETRDMDGDPMTTDDVTEVEIDERDRWFVESQFTIPGVAFQGGSGRLKLRLYADLPMSGDGPSDIRISALFGFNVSQWINGLD